MPFHQNGLFLKLLNLHITHRQEVCREESYHATTLKLGGILVRDSPQSGKIYNSPQSGRLPAMQHTTLHDLATSDNALSPRWALPEAQDLLNHAASGVPREFPCKSPQSARDSHFSLLNLPGGPVYLPGDFYRLDFKQDTGQFL